MNRANACLVLLIALAAKCYSQLYSSSDPFPERDTKLPAITCNVRVEFLLVEMAQDPALKMIAMLRDGKQSRSAVDKIWSGIAREQIRLVAAATSLTGNGRITLSECGEGITYPTEPWPIVPPQSFGAAPVVTPDPPPPRNFFFQNIDVPTAWESRRTGLTIELQANTSVENVLSVTCSPQFVELQEMQRYLSRQNKEPTRPQSAQPQFRKEAVMPSLRIQSGEWQLISSTVVRTPKPRMRLFLLRCTNVPIQK